MSHEVDTHAATEPPASPRRRFRRRHETELLEQRLSVMARQLDAYERKLGELSRAQTTAELTRREELVELQRRLAQLEEANLERDDTIRELELQRVHRLTRLRHTIAGQRRALEGLEQTLSDDAETADDNTRLADTA